jgi:hypothetical protein
MMTLKIIRAACLIACAGLYACTPTQESKPAPAPAPVEAPAPAKPPPEPEKPPEVLAAPLAPPQAAPEPAPKVVKKSAPRRKAPARKPAPPPAVKAPAPPPVVIPPAPSPEQERARKLADYIAALEKAQLTFDPPSPMQVEQRVAVQLSLTPTKETAQLAEDLRKSLSDPGAWRPRLRAQLGGASFEIAPAEAKDLAGEKDLSAAGRTEWTWNVLPKLPGAKQLTARVAILLPPGSGDRELPALQRDVRVEPTLAWTLGNLWSEYWLWFVAMLIAVVAALLWWRRQRFAGEG